MKGIKTPFYRFITLLKAGYQHRESPPEVSLQWHQDVMRAVRHIGPLDSTANSLVFMNRFVWRFASVATVCVLLLSIYVAVASFNSNTGVLSQFLENPVGFMLAQAIGGY